MVQLRAMVKRETTEIRVMATLILYRSVNVLI